VGVFRNRRLVVEDEDTVEAVGVGGGAERNQERRGNPD
jgi:hypothetical protein